MPQLYPVCPGQHGRESGGDQCCYCLLLTGFQLAMAEWFRPDSEQHGPRLSGHSDYFF